MPTLTLHSTLCTVFRLRFFHIYLSFLLNLLKCVLSTAYFKSCVCVCIYIYIYIYIYITSWLFNPLNAKLNPICHLLALLGAHHIFHLGRIRIKLSLMYTVFLLSFPRTRHTYRTESMRPKTHSVTDAGPRQIRHYTVGTPDDVRVSAEKCWTDRHEWNIALYLMVFKQYGQCTLDARPNILIYIQQDATLRSLFYLGAALHFSGGTTTHHQERI